MQFTSEILPGLIKSIADTIERNEEEVTALDQVCGDGDHIINLQRGIDALIQQSTEFTELDWKPALQKIGMTLLTTMGGASGSLFGTLFISMSKAIVETDSLTQAGFSDAYMQGVEAVKKRGKSDAGEKTMLDVLIPVAEVMQQGVVSADKLAVFLENVSQAAVQGMESTKDMLATKGRASYLGDKTIGHIDAGARTSQLMICAMVEVCKRRLKAKG